MSLADKWEEFRKQWYTNAPESFVVAAQRAYYAGAEAALDCPDKRSHFEDISELRAEIDRFKGLK